MTSCRPVVPQRISATGRSARTPCSLILLRDRFDPLDAHQHHLGSAKFGQRPEIDGALSFLRIFMPSEKGHVRSDSAMRHRNARVSWCGDRRSDAGHDFERRSRRRQSLRLLAATAEQEWVAAL